MLVLEADGPQSERNDQKPAIPQQVVVVRNAPHIGDYVDGGRRRSCATAGRRVEHAVQQPDKHIRVNLPATPWICQSTTTEPAAARAVRVAIQRDRFGQMVAENTSGGVGEVTGQRSDAMAEPGNPLALIQFHSGSADGAETYPE